jgi:hypothetical protein
MQISNIIQIRPAGAELFHADQQMDGQTDMTKLIVAFHNFASAPKKDQDKTFTVVFHICSVKTTILAHVLPFRNSLTLSDEITYIARFCYYWRINLESYKKESHVSPIINCSL